MDINGNLIVVGGGIPVLRNVGPASSGGVGGMQTKGTMVFPNGFKIQWDTVAIPSRSATDYTLPEAYTEAHYMAWGSYASELDVATVTSSFTVFVKTLSLVRAYSNKVTTAEEMTYISFGKDAV